MNENSNSEVNSRTSGVSRNRKQNHKVRELAEIDDDSSNSFPDSMGSLESSPKNTEYLIFFSTVIS